MPQVPPALTESDVDKRMTLWHNDPTLDTDPWDYLGWTEKEYHTWVLDNTLPRRNND